MNLVQKKVCRWMEILSNLDKLGFLTTSQIQRLHHLGGRRNTTRILNDMGDYLNSFQLDEKVYYLNAKGRKEIGSTKIRKRTLQIHHHLIRNDVFIKYQPEYWKPEFRIKWEDKIIKPDATFRTNNEYAFLEVDYTQSMANNEKKIELYRELKETQLFQKKYGMFPKIMFVTISEHRFKMLRGLLDGVRSEVFMQDEIF